MAAIPGASTTGLLSPDGRLSKATMHPVWRNRNTGKFSAILPTGTAWNLWPDLSVPGTSVATNKGNQNLRPTVVTHATGYYVIWASTTTSRFQAYDWSNAMVGAEVNLPFSIVNHDQSPTTAVIDSLGQIWIAYAQTGIVNVIRSTDNGLTWTGPTQIGTFQTSQSGVIGLVESNGFMQSLSNGNDSSGRSAKRISLTATDLAQPNWTVETLPPFDSGTSSDDHLGITAAPDGTVYAILKTTNGAANAMLIYVLVRTPAGVWSAHNVEVGPDNDEGVTPGYSRPNIFEVNGELRALYSSIHEPNNLSTKTATTANPAVWSARTALIAGPDFSDGALLPGTGEVVAPVQQYPVLVHQRLDNTVDLQWLPTGFPEGGGSMIGGDPVLATKVGATDSPAAYLGTEQVDS
jgi:hypothetical protein